MVVVTNYAKEIHINFPSLTQIYSVYVVLQFSLLSHVNFIFFCFWV